VGGGGRRRARRDADVHRRSDRRAAGGRVTPEPPDAWDNTAAWLARHGALPALGVLTIAMAVLYGHIFTGETGGDDLTFHMAESARIADCLRHGDWDFWNPSANGGFASLYYYQAVPQLASAIPTALFGHHAFWFQLSVVLPHILAPAAAYRGMRLLGATPWQAVIAAGAIAFQNGQSRWGMGNAGTFEVGLYTQTWALAALPVALGHTARWVMDGKGLAPAIAWGTFVWLCHPFAGISLGIILMAAFAALAILAAIAPVFAELAGPELDAPRDLFRAALAHVRRRWRTPPPRPLIPELVRSIVVGVALLVAWMPIYLPLLVDYDGFGGFPHRVKDEVGPGFTTLADWHFTGALLDFGRYAAILTFALLPVLAFVRGRCYRWLWAPALVFAILLGLGPHVGKTSGDDLFPAVRFLGAMQVLLCLGIGAGVYELGRHVWNLRARTLAWWAWRVGLTGVVVALIAGIVLAFALGDADGRAIGIARWATFGLVDSAGVLRALGILVAAACVFAVRPVWRALETQYAQRTGLAALIAALSIMTVLPGWDALDRRIYVLGDLPRDKPGTQRAQIMEVIDILAHQPPGGRKQVGPGCENHWWNLLGYVYGRVPALLQMGGGGLQASPNYDFVWSVRDFKKLAWVYDTPYLVFANDKEKDVVRGETVAKTATHEVRRLPAPGLVSAVHVTGILPAGPTRAGTEVRKKAIEWLRSDDPYKDRHKAYAGHGPAGAPPDAKVLRAWRQDSPGDEADIVAEVEVASPSTFVARESWHPRWHVYLDGREAPVRRLTPDFPAVDVPPGKHVIAFRFERPWWAHASWLAWPLMTLLGWIANRRLVHRARARSA